MSKATKTAARCEPLRYGRRFLERCDVMNNKYNYNCSAISRVGATPLNLLMGHIGIFWTY